MSVHISEPSPASSLQHEAQRSELRQLSYAEVANGKRADISSKICENTVQKCSPSTSNVVEEDRWQAALVSLERERKIQEKIGLVINKRYEVLLKISSGTYGFIYSAYDHHNRMRVAIKFVTGANGDRDLQLQREYDIYRALKGSPGIPEVYWFGTEYGYQILVMQLLGPSLAQLHNYCGRWFTRKTISRIGLQMLDRLEKLHSKNYVHRDVKPENFLVGIGDDEETCYLIDFGLTRDYRCDSEVQQRRYLVGTAKYASISNHKGMTLSRRDDLESLGYVLVEFIYHNLPWSLQKNQSKKSRRMPSKEQLYNRIRVVKEKIDWATVCPEMAPWISYCHRLGFADDPDYDYLKTILHSLSASSDQPHDRNHDRVVQQAERCSTARHPSFYGPGFYSRELISDNYDDGTGRYSWIMRRESDREEMLNFQCLYRWINEGADG